MPESSSPFAALRGHDVVQMIESCPDLGIALHRFESERAARFCNNHKDVELAAQSTWRLHAAVVHLMLQPLVKVFTRACTVASAALCTNLPNELELAYRGEARDSFVWLNCFMAEELEWCTTIGCPTCYAVNVLSSESTVRAIMTAAVLSNANHSTEEAPNFVPVLNALETAISTDPFWSPMHYPHLLGPSEKVADGLLDLKQQCVELAILVTTPPGSTKAEVAPSIDPASSYAIDGISPLLLRRPPASLIPLRPSPFAIRQIQLQEEEQHALTELLSQWLDHQQALDGPRDSLRLITSGQRRGKAQRD
ncbi:hypothetical protein BT63DRAFT_461064 [Microthyrium microscopicum]|uniref:Uncharacterized protein n=1 Tax=Microthyrium microscopicum TaxID=703497 RepID=A0A6A6TWV6_9PEZI|nr:hypothetical protein BT63DRAFT_461064 [Microthyrium microscopicum]